MLDEAADQAALQRQSLRTQREQSGGPNANIGENTVNPEGFWRRSRDGWYHGAGQSYSDRDESDPLRFRTSQGVDVFGTRHQVSLLNKCNKAYGFAVAYGEILLANDRVYINDINTIKYVTAPLTVPWTTSTVTGTVTASSPRGLATDGGTVYIACGTNGIYSTSVSSSTAASFITGTVDRVFYTKGRLFAVYANRVFNPTAAGALPASLLDLGSNWVWVDIVGGPKYIYMLATNGSRTVIYKTTIKPDGTALDIPIVAGELADAQQHGTALYQYAGKIFVHVQTAVQMADIDGNGDLIFGSKIPLAEPVFGSYAAFVGDDRFVWYSNSSATRGDGLGRMDLTVETLPATPAYSNDIRDSTVIGQLRDINSIVTWKGKRIFAAVGPSGTANEVYVESSSYVASGYIDSGLLALDLADPKTPVSIDIEAGGLTAARTITEAISVDRGTTFTSVGTWDSQSDGETSITGVAASRQFELRTTLTSDGTATPVLYRHTLKVEPGVNQGDYVIMRLKLFEDDVDNTGSATGRTPSADLSFLRSLQTTRAVIDVQEGSLNYTATLRDFDWQAQSRCASTDDGSWNGVATVRLKVVTG